MEELLPMRPIILQVKVMVIFRVTPKYSNVMFLIALLCVLCWFGPALKDGANIK